MAFVLKTKETVAITLFTFLVVAASSFVYLSQVTRLTVEQAEGQADLLAKQIYAQSRQALARRPDNPPWATLETDRDLRSLLEASLGYFPYLLYVLIADEDGRTRIHGEPAKETEFIPPRPALADLLGMDPIHRLLALYRVGEVYEVGLPMQLDGRPFGTIRLGISTVLLRGEMATSLRYGATLAAIALPLAWAVTMGLASLTRRRIRGLTLALERFRQGEFTAPPMTAPEDEFKELASQLQLLGEQLQVDRLRTLGSREQLQQLMEQLEDGMILFGEEHRVLFCNRSAEAILGRLLAEIQGHSLDSVLPASHPLRSVVMSGLEEGRSVRNVPVCVSRGGQTREFLVSVFGVGHAEQQLGSMALLKDVDSLKTLQSLVNYSAKLTALGRLTSGVAHEVKNPLNAMAIHVELLKDQLPAAEEGVQESLQVIESEIRRLDRVVQGFLKFVRPQELALKASDLNRLVEEVVGLLRMEWEAAGIQFELQLDEGLPPCAVDEELIRQAILNILLNACQAMPQGGQARVETLREGTLICIRITDQGVGIPPEELDKIFRLYYTTKPDGSGVGLSLVYRTAQLHDGDVRIVSDVGRGTTVSLFLPIR
jgi:PAS domain S-box-containing protein